MNSQFKLVTPNHDHAKSRGVSNHLLLSTFCFAVSLADLTVFFSNVLMGRFCLWFDRCPISNWCINKHLKCLETKRWRGKRRVEPLASGGRLHSPRPASRTTMQILKQTRSVWASSTELAVTTDTMVVVSSSRRWVEQAQRRMAAAFCVLKYLTSSQRQARSILFSSIAHVNEGLSKGRTTTTINNNNSLQSICQPAPISTNNNINMELDSMPAVAYSDTFDQRKYNY